MIGEQFAIFSGQRCACSCDGCVELIELDGVGGRIRGVRRGIRWIHLHEHIADDRHVLRGKFRVGPEMGIRLAPGLGEGEVVDVVINGQHRCSEFTKGSRFREVGGGKFLCRFLKDESVRKDHIGFGQRCRHTWRGFERVRIGALGDDPYDLRQSPGHIRNDRRDWSDSGCDVECRAGGDGLTRQASRQRLGLDVAALASRVVSGCRGTSPDQGECQNGSRDARGGLAQESNSRTLPNCPQMPGPGSPNSLNKRRRTEICRSAFDCIANHARHNRWL